MKRGLEATILVVDDDGAHRAMLGRALQEQGYAVVEAASGEEALEVVRSRPVDLVLLDIKMPGMGGLQALREIKAVNPPLPVLMMTAYATVQTAVSSLKEGAYDYLMKPLDLTELAETVRAGLEPHGEPRAAATLPEELEDLEIVAESRVMQDIIGETLRVAPTDATVLLTGESGTGKEILARVIHRMSRRSERRLLTVNCAAIPDNLVESELFGHVKGAFTGADRDREGRFVTADGGTLFLDEIGEIPPAVQVKLLRVLQDGKITPVGSNREIPTDVRIIAATNRDLTEEIGQGRFREDLFYRLSVFPLHLAPLRERKIDIPPLANHFMRQFARRHGKNVRGLTPRAMTSLVSYPWPGNVRELMNVMERAVILCAGSSVGVGDLPPSVTSVPGEAETAAATGEAGISLKEMERILIEKTLADTGGNRSQASRILGITRKTLLAKIKEYGIEG